MGWLALHGKHVAVLAISILCAAPGTEAAEERLKVGVALSGGGAKGAAHIGVLSVLEENRIPVDIVTGTSMGAYVGGIYAMGLSADELYRRTLKADWSSGYEDRVGRNDLVLRRKKQNDDYQIYTDIGIDIDGSYQSKSGAFQGQGMATLLGQLTGNLPRLDSFDQLAIPYRAVATDIVRVKPVVLDGGHLATAMQASMTVPGALQPVRINDQVLVDGGVVNNMPVDVAKSLGADVVIAVDLRDSLFAEAELGSAFNIIGQLTTFMTNSSADQQKALLTDRDTYLQPEVGFMLAPDFDKMDLAYAAGRKVALAALPELLRYQVSSDEYQAYRASKLDRRSRLTASSAYYIDRIDIINGTRRSDAALRALLNLEPGRVISASELDRAVKRLNSEDIFERITYQIDHQEGVNVLVMDINEKSWGPGYLNFKFAFEDDFANRSDFSFGAQYIYTDLTDKGGEWQFEWLLGSWKQIHTSFYFPLDYQKTLFTNFGAGWNRELRQFRLSEEQADFIGREPGSVVETEYEVFHGFAELGWNLRPWSSLTLGYRGQRGKVVETNQINRQDYDVHGPYMAFVYDDLDNMFFPRTGWLLEAELGMGTSTSQVNALDEFEDDNVYYDVKLFKPISYDKHSLLAIGKFSGSEGDDLLPIYVQDLGGLFNMSGYHRYELNGRYRLFTGLIYSYQLMENNFGALSIPVYIGASIEKGNVWDQGENISWGETLNAGSVFVGLDSPLGPIYFAYGQAEGGEHSIYLSVGTVFD